MTTETWVYIIYATVMLLTWIGGVVIAANEVWERVVMGAAKWRGL